MNLENQNYSELDNRRLLNLALLLIIILSVVFLISMYASKSKRINDLRHLSEKTYISPFEKIVIEAKSAIVYDIKNKIIIFSKNSDETMPLASITKVLAAVTAVDLLPKNAIVNVDKIFLSEEGDSGLYGNEKWKLNDLVDFSLVSSSNDGIAAIAGAAGALDSGTENFEINHKDFISKMNAKAVEIGMTESRFNNETGLDLSGSESGGYSSSRDVAFLFAYVLRTHPEILEATRHAILNVKSENNIKHSATNTNIGIQNIPGLIASKTGYTDMAGGNLAIVFDPGIGRPIAVVALGSSEQGRFSDVSLLTRATFEYLSQGH